MLAEIAMAAIIMATPMPADAPADVPEDYTSASQVEVIQEGYTETVRVTEYCPACNCPAGHGSASGKYLTDGDCACGWLPMGTEIDIDGVTYTVVDVCGTDAIDLFVDEDTGYCVCSRNEYVEAVIRLPEE